jgi:hypothetical protein
MPEQESTRPIRRAATSDDIPRAVEYLIHLLLRWTCLAVAGVLGLIDVVGWLHHWTWWLVVPLLVLTMAALACGLSIRPRGRMVFDRVGASVVVPGQNPPHPDGEERR